MLTIIKKKDLISFNFGVTLGSVTGRFLPDTDRSFLLGVVVCSVGGKFSSSKNDPKTSSSFGSM